MHCSSLPGWADATRTYGIILAYTPGKRTCMSYYRMYGKKPSPALSARCIRYALRGKATRSGARGEGPANLAFKCVFPECQFEFHWEALVDRVTMSCD